MDHRSQQELHAALLSAFPSWQVLADMVSFHLGDNLAALAENTKLAQAVFDLILWADANDKSDELVSAALAANPENMQLLAFAQRTGVIRHGALGEWSQCTGPYGGGVMALALDPHDQRVLYAGTAHSREHDNWVYKSIDGARTWKPLRNGLRGDQVYALAVAYHDSRIIYAGTEYGLFKSTDGGDSWRWESKRNAGLVIRSVALSPQNPDLIALGTVDRLVGGIHVRMAASIYVGPERYSDPTLGGYHTSLDEGHTWITAAIRNVTRVVVSPQDGRIVYLGTAEQGVFRSLDGGNRLENAGQFGQQVFSLAVSPKESRHVVVGTARGLYVSFDAGESWKQSSEISEAEVSDVAFSPADGSKVYAGTSVGVFESRDGGLSWLATETGLVPSDVLALVCGHDETLYAGTNLGGTYRKRSREGSWQMASAGLFSLPGLTLAVQSDSRVHLGTSAGIFASMNRGRSWRNIGPPTRTEVWSLVATPSTLPNPANNTQASGFHISSDRGQSWQAGDDLQVPGVYYAGTSHGRVEKSVDGGMSWQSTDLTSGSAIYSLIAAPNDKDIFHAATIGRGVFSSLDGGTSWQPAGSGIDDPCVAVVAVASQDGQLLYCGTAAHGVYKSIDGGRSWQACGASLPDKPVVSLAIATAEGDTLYAGTQGAGVFKSCDDGMSWSEMNHGLNNYDVRTMLISLQNPTTLFAGTQDGIYRSLDGGASWNGFNRGLGSRRDVNQLALSPSGKVLFAAMATGVYSVNLA